MTQPPRHELPLPWPWRVRWHTLHVDDPATLPPDDEGWGWFTQLLVLAEGPGGVGLEIGWLPDGDPTGRFVASLLAADGAGGFDWDAPMERLETRDVHEVLDAALGWAARYAEPIPDDAHTLAAALAPHHPQWIAPTLVRLLSPERRAALSAELATLTPYFAL
jgi:hypothetical protein